MCAKAISKAETANLPGRRLVDLDVAAGKVGCSPRNWLRLCSNGKAPFGYKVGALRRWDLAELDAWIAGGSKPVGGTGGVA